MFKPRQWQTECMERFLQVLKEGATTFIFEACMGSGKSAMAAMIAKTLLTDFDVDHVIALVPWKSIQGDVDKGMIGTFAMMGLDVRDHFFTLRRRQPKQPRPDMDATVTLYQEVCCQETIETLKMWKKEGFRFALICDEIHHTNEINSSWGEYVEELKKLADYSVFMSGTYFRGDRKPISCVPLDETGKPIKNYCYPYSDGVKGQVVRSVTTRELNARVQIYDKAAQKEYEVMLSEVTSAQLSPAKKQVLDPCGECIRNIIETAHNGLLQTRTKFHDAACLFVCRPGGSDNYTSDDEKGVSQENRHVHIIARQIKELTGIEPVVVTHNDRDAMGKIARFRRGIDPYLVAVNMISEGCDIPRLRSVAFCRYVMSEMLFRQIVGRALRMHLQEDGTAAQIIMASFPLMIQFAERLYEEAKEGIINRRCETCGEWPCECPCVVCGQNPCVCEKICWPPPPPPSTLLAVGATPILDGGHVGVDHVTERFVVCANKLAREIPVHRHSNCVQLGHALQIFSQWQQETESQQNDPEVNKLAEREKFGRQINRDVKALAFKLYKQNFGEAYYYEIEVPFKEKLAVIMQTWGVDRLRQVADRLKKRRMEVFQNE